MREVGEVVERGLERLVGKLQDPGEKEKAQAAFLRLEERKELGERCTDGAEGVDVGEDRCEQCVVVVDQYDEGGGGLRRELEAERFEEVEVQAGVVCEADLAEASFKEGFEMGAEGFAGGEGREFGEVECDDGVRRGGEERMERAKEARLPKVRRTQKEVGAAGRGEGVEKGGRRERLGRTMGERGGGEMWHGAEVGRVDFVGF